MSHQSIFLLTLFACFGQFLSAQTRLWYKQPAKRWEEALPIGNGRLGAMIYGGDVEDEIQFNEETLWTGEPRSYDRVGAYRYLDSIRSLLNQGEQAKAEALAMQQFMGVKSETQDPTAWLAKIARERDKQDGPASEVFNDDSWKSIQVPAYEGWEEVGLEGVDGAVWFRTSFFLTAHDLQEDWTLDLNKVRQEDYTYVNGSLVGHTAGDQQKRLYRIPKAQLREGKNSIAVQVINLAGKGGISGYKDTTQKIGLHSRSGKFTGLGGAWKYWIQDAQTPKIGTYQASYQPFGSLRIRFPEGTTENYTRSLDLEKGMVSVAYQQNHVSYNRTYFASYPDKVIAARFEASEAGRLSFTIHMDSKHAGYQIRRIDAHTLAMQVNVKDGALAGISFLTVKLQGGKMFEQDGVLHIENARVADVYLTAATNFKRYNEVDTTAVYSQRAAQSHRTVLKKSYERLLARHQQDYQALYHRFSIDLGGAEKDALPTDERLKAFAQVDDPGLIALYVQYGRYLQIASSRQQTQAANLQGIWNHLLEPAWGSKYTTNINLEMNYWPTEMLNLSELHQPLFDMIRELSVAGQQTAKQYYNARGWVLHHNTDLWRGTAPINNANHGIWPTGGAWLVTHLWEHYLYNQDPRFIESYYNIIKGATLFFKDVLVKDEKTGWYISTPSNSPENGGLVNGPTMDHQLIRALFAVFVESSTLVKKDGALRDSIQRLIPAIAPNQIGKNGQLQEWMEDIDDPNNKHRHVSHLWALHPGREITKDKTPALFEAAKKSLEMRGDDGTGWSLAWKINFWARLHDAQHTYTMVKMLLRPADKAGGSYPNLFDAHPPFQIDGNFGGAAGIGEMLLQSHAEFIDVLPALPAELAEGQVNGLRARGNFELDIHWEKHQLAVLTVRSQSGRPLKLRYRGKTITLPTKKNVSYRFDAELNRLK